MTNKCKHVNAAMRTLMMFDIKDNINLGFFVGCKNQHVKRKKILFDCNNLQSWRADRMAGRAS